MLTIIIPTLNEAGVLPGLLGRLGGLDDCAEIVVVDGGSSDTTVAVAERELEQFRRGVCIESDPGRGTQLAVGAERASGDLLCLLHADSMPSRAMIDYLRRAATAPTSTQRDHPVTLFRLRFDSRHPILRLYALFARLESFWTSFGDQGILVGRNYYRSLGGFTPLPILEDVDFLERARGRGRIGKRSEAITTSARRFRQLGPIRTQLWNLAILLRYRSGADLEQIASTYRDRGSGRL